MIKAAVIGAGHMGEYHIRIYTELMNVKLVGIVDINFERAKFLAGCYKSYAYKNYKELFGKVDLVSIAVPTSHHYEIAKDCLINGINVLLEKPMTLNLKQAKELFEIAENKKVALHIGHVERFNGAVTELKKIIKDPIYLDFRRLAPYNPRISDTGVVMDLMIHDLDILLNLIDSKIVKISAFGRKIYSQYEDIATVQILFKNNCLANIVASRVTEEKFRTLAITQKDAYIFLDYTTQDIHIHRGAKSEYFIQKEEVLYKQESIIERIFVHKENPLKREIEHFIHSAVNKLYQQKDRIELKSLALALEIEKMIGGK